jgi:hypothetical protein
LQNPATGDEEGTENRDWELEDFNDSSAITQYTSLTTYLSQGHTDPFASAAVELTNPRYSYFYHCTSPCLPTLPPTPLPPSSGTIANESQSEPTQSPPATRSTQPASAPTGGARQSPNRPCCRPSCSSQQATRQVCS